MALPLHQILTRPTYIQPVRVIIKRCGNPRCHHMISTHDGFEYIHSKANDNFYCGTNCLANAEGIKIDWLDPDKSKIEWMIKEWEVEECG